MKRFLVMILVCMLVWGVFIHANHNSKVLLILREGKSLDLEFMLTKEAAVMTSILEEAGFEVVTASASGQPLVGSATTLKPDMKLSDAKVTDYAGIIMPCLAKGLLAWKPAPETAAIVKQAVTEGIPVATQLGATYILLETGVLKGKRYAFFTDPLNPSYEIMEKDTRFADSIYSGTGIVQDGTIITSGVCPYAAKEFDLTDGTVKLTKTLIAEITRK